AAHRHAVPRTRIRQREIIIMMVGKSGGSARVVYALVAAVVILIDHGAHPLLQIAAERRLPADAQHLAARAQAVAEIALLGTPVALYDAVIGRAVQENIVHVPLVLPLGNFVGKVEVVPNAREIDADGRLRIAEQVAAAVGIIFAAILEIHRERGLAGID